jgi:hypothetical protein
MKKILILSLVVISLETCLAQSSKVVRGPYLQNLTPTSVTVRWRTDKATESKVIFGTQAEKLNEKETDKKLTTEHEVVLKGLDPKTKYFYTFGSEKEMMKADTEQYFVTAPKAGSAEPIRIWALGDFGCSSKNQFQVRDAILKNTADRRPDVWLWLGDNAYGIGTDEEFQKHVFGVYQEGFFKNMPFWATPGNHDYAGKHNPALPPYFKIFSMPQLGEAGGVPSGSESYFSFDYGNIHFVSLDCEGKLDANPNEYGDEGKFLWDTTGKQVEWLKKDLTANKQPWTIVFWHRPPYSKGSHDSDTEEEMVKIRENLLPILERYNVDIVFSGHSHVYERTHPLVGHYGLDDTFDPKKHIVAETTSADNYVVKGKKQGIIYIVNGSGGQLGGKEPGYPLNSAVYSNNTEGGSMILDVKGNKLEAQWICGDGVVRDKFSITK